MNNRTHFQNDGGTIFSKAECQLACAMHLYIRTRRHLRLNRHVDHSQPPTHEMLDEILREARWSIWEGARGYGAPCNPMRPDVPLDAYCLVRNLRANPYHEWWYREVRDYPEVWVRIAYNSFHSWVSLDTTLVRRYVSPIPCRLVGESHGC